MITCRTCNKTTDHHREYRKDCIDCERKLARERMFKYTRGITHEERDEMLASQGGKCACCGATEPGSKKGWHTEHCHTTDMIRAVLCAHCNVALGYVKEDETRIKQLLIYVQKYCSEGVTTIETTAE